MLNSERAKDDLMKRVTQPAGGALSTKRAGRPGRRTRTLSIPAQFVTMCSWCIGAGAMATGAVMVLFSKSVSATNSSLVTDSIVHISNVKFMAAMWLVVGALFVVGAPYVHEPNTWRLLRIACIGISLAAVVRIVEMARFNDWSTYAICAAAVELTVPPMFMWLRRQMTPSTLTTGAPQ